MLRYLTSFFYLVTYVHVILGDTYLPLLMPGVKPLVPETYLCTAFKMPDHNHQFVVEYLPNATAETAHHILIYGCEEPGYVWPGNPGAVWDCGEMALSVDAAYTRSPVCGNDADGQILYSWAMDAPPFKLPEGVGFKVGNGSANKYLVLQVHYAHVHRFIDGAIDHSGITIKMLPPETNAISKLAGVLELESKGRILPKTTEHFESVCEIDQDIEIHPFAFRIHTHKLGKVVAGYKIEKTTNKWHEIGKQSPLNPQMFYPITDQSLTLSKGDTIATRCTMYNFEENTVAYGPTADDEMCDYYIMYYVNQLDHILNRTSCYTPGPPSFYWRDVFNVPESINREASTLK